MDKRQQRNRDGQTWYQWASELFRFENCHECGKGVKGHEPAGFRFEEGCPVVFFFAKCKEEPKILTCPKHGEYAEWEGCGPCLREKYEARC